MGSKRGSTFFCGVATMFLFTLHKELLYESSVFIEDELPYIILSSYITWGKCHSHLASSFIRHVGAVNCRK
jgi:hypothetical protein